MGNSGEERLNRRQESWPGAEGDLLDREIDAALAKYSAVEPRDGLEHRILANLRAQPQATTQPWLRWVVVGAVAMLAVVVALSVSLRTRRRELVRLPTHVTNEAGKDAQAMIAAKESQPPKQPAPVHMAVAHRARNTTTVAHSTSRLSQFPSPAPVSDQEEMLATYVRQFEQQAVLIARFNEDDLRRDRMELIDGVPPNEGDFEENKVR